MLKLLKPLKANLLLNIIKINSWAEGGIRSPKDTQTVLCQIKFALFN